jgi:nitrate/TMAO reductase-like tetraheme cytochrome c subunit
MTRVLITVVILAACGDSPKLPVAELEDPARCMECHGQHYTEWSGSMHAYASQDPVFVAMNKRGQRETGNQLGTFCVQCHAPMAVALGLTDGTDFDPAQLPPAANGVTCYFCHDVKSVQADHNNGLQLALDDTMRGGVKDPTDSPAHHSKYDKLMDSYTNQSTMCGSCHDVTTPAGAKLERTYAEWQTTVFTMNDPTSGVFELTCSGCHMQSDPTTTIIADKPGLSVKSRPNSFHEHMWLGIDQALTAFPETDAQAAAIKRDLDGAVTIVGATPIGKHIGEGGICVLPNGTITVRMDTRGTGHMWPSGAAQDRRAWLELTAYDSANAVVFSSGVVADGADPDPNTDPTLFGLWDRTFTDAGMPAHFFWEVSGGPNGIQPQALKPPVTLDMNSKLFDHSTTNTFTVGLTQASQIDHITARLRIRPLPYAVLQDLVTSGDLDPGVVAQMQTLDIKETLRHWERATMDPATGCNPNPFD